MIFGNALTIEELEAAVPQEQIFAMRTDRPVPLDEVALLAGLSTDEIRRFNPALVNRVPAGANLYLPSPVDELGRDTTFWHAEPTPEYAAALDEFLRLDERFSADDWHDGTALDTLRDFETRFRETGTEEGAVMATTIAFVLTELSDTRQMDLLAGIRNSEPAQLVREQAVLRRETLLQATGGSRGDWAFRSLLFTNGVQSLR